MMIIRGFIQKRPVLTYFALTFALSWGSWLVLTGGAPMRADPRFMLIILSAPVAPAIGGLLMIALTTADPVGLLLPGVTGGILVGFCEELGWTGFAIPRLRLRYSVLATGLLMGVVWGTWHAPLFSRSDSFAGVLPLTLLLAQLFAWLPAYRVLMVWVYDRTGSLLVTILMHASQAATSIIFPPATSDIQALISILVSAGVWWLFVAAVAIANREQVLHKNEAPSPVSNAAVSR